jgi:hypothetical protein
MRFDIPVEILIQIESEDPYESFLTTPENSAPKELFSIMGYIPAPRSMFAICKNPTDSCRWGIVHRPSEEMFLSIFNKKKDAERYFDFLMEEYDVDSLFLVSPDLSHVEEEFKKAYMQAYFSFINNRWVRAGGKK